MFVQANDQYKPVFFYETITTNGFSLFLIRWDNGYFAVKRAVGAGFPFVILQLWAIFKPASGQCFKWIISSGYSDTILAPSFQQRSITLTWCHTGARIANLCVPNWPHVEFIFHPWLGRLLGGGQTICEGNFKSNRSTKSTCSKLDKSGRNMESFWWQSHCFQSVIGLHRTLCMSQSLNVLLSRSNIFSDGHS